MTQDRSIQANTSANLSRALRGRRVLVIAGILIASTGIVATVISAVAASFGPLNIRGFLDSEKTGQAYGPDFTAAWVWAAVAVMGVAVVIVGVVRSTKTGARN